MKAQSERNVCRKRESGFVFEQDKQGYYTVPVFDPLASVISYLRDQRWLAQHNSQIDLIRVWGLLDAVEVCNTIANQ